MLTTVNWPDTQLTVCIGCLILLAVVIACTCVIVTLNRLFIRWLSMDNCTLNFCSGSMNNRHHAKHACCHICTCISLLKILWSGIDYSL